jgi:hypothetical protein
LGYVRTLSWKDWGKSADNQRGFYSLGRDLNLKVLEYKVKLLPDWSLGKE